MNDKKNINNDVNIETTALNLTTATKPTNRTTNNITQNTVTYTESETKSNE